MTEEDARDTLKEEEGKQKKEIPTMETCIPTI